MFMVSPAFSASRPTAQLYLLPGPHALTEERG
jgi:hypothetical protein